MTAPRPGRRARYCSAACKQRAYRSRRDAASVSGNLVRRLDSFIGRNRERTALARLIRSQRLVTVAGPPGVGKTRLAIEVAGAQTIAGGVWFVDLTAVQNPEQVDQAVAGAVGAEAPGGPAREALAARLRTQPALLLLDNCEHVIDSCADLVAWLLPRCPAVRVLATSRESMRIAGEHIYTLGPLPISSDAVRLFADRAEAVDHEFVLTPAIIELCRRLDGLPLAIELAARRIRHLPTTDLAGLLRTGDRATERHRGVDDAIAWSYDLLDPDEQAALRRLSVLAGRFHGDEAAAACDTDNALELLVNLTTKSLVAIDDGGFRVLEAIRMFGQARLREHGELDATMARLVEWFARAWEPRSTQFGPDMTALRSLCEQVGTLAAVTDWALSGDDPRAPLLTWALAVAWVSQGHLVEARALVLRALDRGMPLRYRAPLLSIRANIDDWSGRLDQAVATHWEVVRIEEQLGRPARLARAHAGLGMAFERMDELDRARRHYLTAVALLRPVGDRSDVANLLHCLGYVAFRQGDLPTAFAELDEARQILDMLEMQPVELAAMWHDLGEVQLALGDADAAQRHFAKSIRAMPDTPHQVVYGLKGLAAAAADTGEPERALRIAETAIAIQREVGPPEPRWQRHVDATIALATARVGDRRARSIRTSARRMSLSQAVDYALAGVHEAGSPLSVRQLEICRSVAKGQTDQQIATELGVSTRTVTTYMEQIRAKLGLRSRAEVAAWVTEYDGR